jgi:hypothetical protein
MIVFSGCSVSITLQKHSLLNSGQHVLKPGSRIGKNEKDPSLLPGHITYFGLEQFAVAAPSILSPSE